jgi:hypothetical protein
MRTTSCIDRFDSRAVCATVLFPALAAAASEANGQDAAGAKNPMQDSLATGLLAPPALSEQATLPTSAEYPGSAHCRARLLNSQPLTRTTNECAVQSAGALRWKPFLEALRSRA